MLKFTSRLVSMNPSGNFLRLDRTSFTQIVDLCLCAIVFLRTWTLLGARCDPEESFHANSAAVPHTRILGLQIGLKPDRHEPVGVKMALEFK